MNNDFFEAPRIWSIDPFCVYASALLVRLHRNDCFPRLVDEQRQIEYVTEKVGGIRARALQIIRILHAAGFLFVENSGRIGLGQFFHGAELTDVHAFCELLYFFMQDRYMSDVIRSLISERLGGIEAPQSAEHFYRNDLGNIEQCRSFAESLMRINSILLDGIFKHVSFRNGEHVLDVGGGAGDLACAITARTLVGSARTLERPMMIEAVKSLEIWAEDVIRSSFISGDFFGEIPGGFDSYILKWVIHDWPDEMVGRILGVLKASMNAGERVVCIESCYGTSQYDAMVAAKDIMRLVYSTGKERSIDDIEMLFSLAGFQKMRSRSFVTAVIFPMTILEFCCGN